MSKLRCIVLWVVVGMVVAAGLPGVAWAEKEAEPQTWLAAIQTDAAVVAAAAVPAETGWEKPGMLKALSVSLDYTMVTDYVWRGINLSEYAGEGREKLNHQLNVGFEIDPAELGAPPIGRVGGSVWFEWYGGQERLTTWSSDNLQEVDYTVYWAYDVDPIGLGLEIGWIAYHFPRFRDSDMGVEGDVAYTHEVYLSLSFDDSKIFGKPILNPTAAFYLDVDDVRASFLTFGISHDFALAEWGMGQTPIFKDVTISPSLTLGVDHRYYDKVGVGSDNAIGTRLGYLEYGLVVAYDLGGALNIPEQFGSLSLSGFLNFCQSFHDDNAAVQDEFYGGFNVGWAW